MFFFKVMSLKHRKSPPIVFIKYQILFLTGVIKCREEYSLLQHERRKDFMKRKLLTSVSYQYIKSLLSFLDKKNKFR